MATPQSQPEAPVQVTRTFSAPRDRVFRAWTDAKQLALWFHPTADYTTVVTELNLRVGGGYRLEMHHKGGNIHILRGTYQEILPPERLVFTWNWERPDAPLDSVVTVEFLERAGSTEVVISHRNLPDAESRAKHTEGWAGCLGQLQQYLA